MRGLTIGGFVSTGRWQRGRDRDSPSTELLDQPDDTGNLGSSQVGSLETVGKLHTGSGLHLELVGVVHHGDLLLGVILGESRASGGQSHQRPLGIGESTLLGQPPGALRGESDTESDRQDPDPLDGKGDLVGPLGLVADEGSVDSGTDDLADNPEAPKRSSAQVSKEAHCRCRTHQQRLT